MVAELNASLTSDFLESVADVRYDGAETCELEDVWKDGCCVSLSLFLRIPLPPLLPRGRRKIY